MIEFQYHSPTSLEDALDLLDRYGDDARLMLEARVGPMGLNFSGTISVLQQDRTQGEARFRVEGSDRRVSEAATTIEQFAKNLAKHLDATAD